LDSIEFICLCFEKDYNKEYEQEIKTKVYGPLINGSILENFKTPHILFDKLDQFQSNYIKKALSLSKGGGEKTWANFRDPEELRVAFDEANPHTEIRAFRRSGATGKIVLRSGVHHPKITKLENLKLFDPFDALRSFYDCVNTYIYLSVRNKGKGHFQFMDTRGNTKSDLELYSLQRVIPSVPWTDTIEEDDEFNDSKKRENYFLTIKKAMKKIHVDRKVLIPVIVMRPN